MLIICKGNGSGVVGATSRLWALVVACALATGCASNRPPAAKVANAAPFADTQARPEVVTKPIELTADTVELLESTKALRLGIETEREAGWPHLKNKRVALVTNNTSIDQLGVPTLERFLDCNEFTLSRVFRIHDPEYLPTLCMEPVLARVPADRLSVLTAEEFRPTEAMLEGVDVVVWDVSLTGPRFNVDTAALGAILEEASLRNIRVLVADRPNVTPMGMIEGPPGDAELTGSRESIFPVGICPGLTAGELAQLINREFAVQADLTVLQMENWVRKDGNAWLFDGNPDGRLTEKGANCRGGLNHTLYYRSGYVELTATLELTGTAIWERAHCSADGFGLGYLALIPRGMTTAAFMEELKKAPQLSGLSVTLGNPAGTVDWGAEAVVLRPSGEGVIFPMELSLVLQHLAREGLKDNPAPKPSSLYGNRLIPQALSRGLGPDQIRRRWSITQEAKKWPEIRTKYVVYGDE